MRSSSLSRISRSTCVDEYDRRDEHQNATDAEDGDVGFDVMFLDELQESFHADLLAECGQDSVEEQGASTNECVGCEFDVEAVDELVEHGRSPLCDASIVL